MLNSYAAAYKYPPADWRRRGGYWPLGSGESWRIATGWRLFWPKPAYLIGGVHRPAAGGVHPAKAVA